MNNVNVELNDVVRSYDFVGNYDCYFEGKVVAILGDFVSPVGNACYQIKPTKRVLDGAERPFYAEYIYPPLNGLPGFGGPSKGVVVLSKGGL